MSCESYPPFVVDVMTSMKLDEIRLLRSFFLKTLSWWYEFNVSQMERLSTLLSYANLEDSLKKKLWGTLRLLEPRPLPEQRWATQ